MLPGVHVGLGLKWIWWNGHLTPKDCSLRTEKKLLTVFHFLSRLREIKDHTQSLEVGAPLWCFLLFQPLTGIFDKGQTGHLYIKGDYPEFLLLMRIQAFALKANTSYSSALVPGQGSCTDVGTANHHHPCLTYRNRGPKSPARNSGSILSVFTD